MFSFESPPRKVRRVSLASDSVTRTPSPCPGSSTISSVDSLGISPVASLGSQEHPLEVSPVSSAPDPILLIPQPEAKLPIEIACASMIAKLPSWMRPVVDENLAALLDLQRDAYPNGLPLGSACSGSDLVTPAVDMLFGALGTGFLSGDGVTQPDSGYCAVSTCPMPSRVDVQVKWACEVAPKKQRWLQEVMLMNKVLQDIRDISSRVAPTTSSECEVVDDIFLYSCGFCCQSVSKQNKNCKDFEGCCTTGVGKTGITYQASVAFIRKRLPVIVLMENVGGLSQKDRARVIADMERCGYKVIILQSNSSQHYLPASRDRVWFIGVLDPDPESMFPSWIAQERAEMIEEATRSTGDEPEANVDEYLVKYSDPLFYVLEEAKRNEKVPKKARQNQIAKEKKLKWVKKHGDFWKFMKVDDRWTGSKPEFTDSGGLTRREADLVKADIFTNDKDYCTDKKVFLDVSQSLDRYPRSLGTVPTILPGGHICIASRKLFPWSTKPEVRDLFGLEALRLQGLHESLVPSPASVFSFKDRELLHLAGNAFSFPHVQLALLCVLAGFDMPGSMEEIVERRAMAANQRRIRMRRRKHAQDPESSL